MGLVSLDVLEFAIGVVQAFDESIMYQDSWRGGMACTWTLSQLFSYMTLHSLAPMHGKHQFVSDHT